MRPTLEPIVTKFNITARATHLLNGLMVALDVKQNKLIGVAVTKHVETAGLGAKAQSDPKFAGQFKGASAAAPVKVTQDGGSINAISGATIT